MKGSVSSLAISTAGNFIISGNYNRYDNMSGDGFIHLQDIGSKESVTKFYTGHHDVNIVAISPCDTYIASGNADKEKNEVLVFDVRNPRKVLHVLSHDRKSLKYINVYMHLTVIDFLFFLIRNSCKSITHCT